MNVENLTTIKGKADFLAHAEMLVQESLEWYGQLADSMELHNNLDAAAKFRELENMEKQQLQWLEQQATGLTLPEIAPWDFAWSRFDDPEKNWLSDIDYLSNPASVLAAALHSENHAEGLYRQIAEQAPSPDVKNVANEMAELQLHQIKLLKLSLSELPEEARESVEDMDPPNMPE